MFSDLRPTDVIAAADRIRPLVKRTPLVRSDRAERARSAATSTSSSRTNRPPARSSCAARSTCSRRCSPDVRARGVVASSAGNHGLGVAYAAKHFGVPATIFVPSERAARSNATESPRSAQRSTRRSRTTTPRWTRRRRSRPSAGRRSSIRAWETMLLAGQGTVALEILGELPDLATLVVNVGGGGLLGGCATSCAPLRPAVRIVGAQSENTAAMSRSLAAGRLVEIDNAADARRRTRRADRRRGVRHRSARARRDRRRSPRTKSRRRSRGCGAKHNSASKAPARARRAPCGCGKVTAIATPAAIVVSGGNIDAAKFAKITGG